MPDPISWEFSGPYLLAAFAGGYFLGSSPFGLLLARLAGLGDIRGIGSGSIGATNVLRTGRKGLAAATLLLDGGKGAAAVFLAGNWGDPDPQLMAALGAVLGHIFPFWLRFQGGKGVATLLGVLLAFAWPAGLAACATWLLIAGLLRYASLAALVALAVAPLYIWLFTRDLQLVELIAVLAAMIWIRHRANIVRLLKGEEPRIGGKPV
ncbi:MAG: glycerol-3-phosphate 1-O-acyltransferase PlsY [Proteobacteria bacterium]|nr:glycerol-3-phosphate 1-O-acyltransferase PlsY [Pseudomonadota bacterium]